ncbi:MAG: Stage V sporulation protein E [Candidatus Curtissbacteria bacterium GW2011_GWA1_40_47]|uniref:Probable peptidoglycan glycosyltransferase FtsW n=1 Tax=Candidatus Curtissbacteria bacterium RIFOXYA1_FULL_41_14 TaxID=1797737 RepID=A0A1F5HAF0_9BACT|nr:MAG: Stage V sporulation protein E [Microgenomates group bacterium GW2011_GWC1_40_35]KKR64591.1 MAG: Stage V sporulation protein E [Candidatus Curtissbacteria bacterium GW2011_GWA1_40_47]KKR76602.1 MAG: Stage V sporulation protein E [Candidatus Curtissbacteria bacterium GW2011_GWD1_40_8]KKS02611.1 MAG: Stage V sporulation protein E [Candidatus Curtissbacteria bacterium GW2011_GWC2_41_21]OGD93042.1 MAG: cell division protein FtsW [Candidatus Curtissbacteria bacterium RIFCSPHIGHO2_12_FULL_41_1
MEDRNPALKSAKKGIDIPLLGVTILLVFIGLLAIYDASVVSAFRDFGDKLYYFKNQLIWAGISLTALGFFSFFNYHKLLKLSLPILGLAIVLLVLVLIPHIGTEAYGARRWINIGNFTFQPSEFAKLAVIFYTASIMAKFENFKIYLKDVLSVLFLPITILTALVLVEPDLGTAFILVAITLAIYFVGHSPIWHLMLVIPMALVSTIAAVITQPYRLERLKSFIDPNYDPQGASYQINQIIIAISSGNPLFGVGIGSSRSKFAFIPEVHSDAIFAVLVEETGFIGALFLISLFLFLITRALNIARNASDYQGKILAMGIIGMLSLQVLLNLASNVALVPLTGVPLPLISYGGSSLLVTMSSIGILLNIKRQA